MYSKTVIAAATALAALFPTALANGKATVKNQCDEGIQLTSVAESDGGDPTEVKSGGSYTETFREGSDGGGVSLKLSFDDSLDDISQFEYTLAPSQDMVFYDLSNVNGYPFQKGGASIEPSDDSCDVVTCDAGVSECTDAYNEPFDDLATKGCAIDTDLTLTLCPDSSSSKVKRTAGHPHFFQA